MGTVVDQHSTLNSTPIRGTEVCLLTPTTSLTVAFRTAWTLPSPTTTLTAAGDGLEYLRCTLEWQDPSSMESTTLPGISTVAIRRNGRVLRISSASLEQARLRLSI